MPPTFPDWDRQRGPAHYTVCMIPEEGVKHSGQELSVICHVVQSIRRACAISYFLIFASCLISAVCRWKTVEKSRPTTRRDKTS